MRSKVTLCAAQSDKAAKRSDTSHVTSSRAHALPKGRDVTLSHVTLGRDSDMTLSLRECHITVTRQEPLSSKEQDKARMAADPRFAQWASMDLGPLADPVDPVAERAILERRELFRLAGVNALARSRNGRDLDPQARADALHWAAYPPLQGPMGNGEPQA